MSILIKKLMFFVIFDCVLLGTKKMPETEL